MKSILLTTTALVAFAGAAVADGHTGVSFKGSAALGYNDDGDLPTGFVGTTIGDNQGFYWVGHLDVKMSAELDNGVTAAVTFDTDFADAPNLGENLKGSDFVLSLTTDAAGLYFGDVAFAAEGHWKAAGSMLADGFSEADGETAIRADMNYGDVDLSVSFVTANKGEVANAKKDNELNQLSFGAAADLGDFSVAVAYQAKSDEAAGFYAANGDFNDAEIFGVSVATTVAGATVRVAYADNSTTKDQSTGVSVSYPVGPVTVSGYVVSEGLAGRKDSNGIKAVYSDGPISLTANFEDRNGADRSNFDASYDVGNGLTVFAGTADRKGWTGEATYIAGQYDLGGGAALLVSYADAKHAAFAADDEVGPNEYQVGTTVEVSFKF